MLPAGLLGTESEEVVFAWKPEDVMLYALAVGAGQRDPGQELEFTTENSQGLPLAVLPTFANIITRRARVDLTGINPARIVHAQQGFQLHQPLPVEGRARVQARVTEVWDKGSGALLTIESCAVDAQTSAPLATSVMSLFVRGGGGFGGDRGPASSWSPPVGAPDLRARFVTRPEQALIYRLTGDRNPLHSDPEFASRGGFTRPLLHGMCTYGYVGRLLVQAFCSTPTSAFSSMTARFAKPVYPGDELQLSAWSDGGEVRFSATQGEAMVVDQGLLTLTAPETAGLPASFNAHAE